MMLLNQLLERANGLPYLCLCYNRSARGNYGKSSFSVSSGCFLRAIMLGALEYP